MIDIKELGDKIKFTRKSKKLSQEGLSELARIHINTFKKIESGKGSPSIESLVQICTALDLSIDELLDLKKRHIKKSELIFEIISILPKLNENQLAALLALSTSSFEELSIPTRATFR
jgi:transcriptional regulator with XRE-family HTH domain